MDITVAPARLVLRAKVREPVFIFHTYNMYNTHHNIYIHEILHTVLYHIS